MIMTTPELLEFIRIEHALGMSLSEITSLLIREGEWDMADVAEAFRALGLPEEAVESFSVTPKTVAPTPAQKPEIEKGIVYHAPEPEMVKAPTTTAFRQRPAPMHYVEQPEEPKKPTLARPASLKGQVSRNLVRTVSTAASYAKVEKPKVKPLEHHAEAPYISKIATGPVKHGIVGLPDEIGAPRPKQKEVSGPIEEIQNALSIGLGVSEEEPKPKSVATPVQAEKKPGVFDASKLHIGKNGEVVSGEEEIVTKPVITEAEISPIQKAEEKPLEKIEIAPQLKVEEKKEEVKPIEKIEEKPVQLGPTPEEQIKAIEEATFRFAKSAEKKEEKKEEKVEIKVEEKKEEKIEVPPTPKIEEKPTVIEPPLFVKAGEPVPPVAMPEIKAEVPAVPVQPISKPEPVVPPVQPQPQAQPFGQMPPQGQMPYGSPWQPTGQMPPQMPQQQMQGQMPYGGMYGQPYGMPPQMPPQPYYAPPPQPVYAQPQIIVAAPTSPQPSSLAPHEPHTEEIGGMSPDIEEQAYLAQFGQAKMPEGLVRPQPTVVSPTIIYAQQVVAPAAPSAPAQEEEKKPEPMRFDIGKIRTSRKMDQTSYSDRPSIISAVSGMEPVKSKSIEDTFKESGETIKASDIPMGVQKKDVISSLKVPFKRTMISDIAKLEEGTLPGQVVAASTGEGESNLITTSQVNRVVEEEPLPPPPPKKASKSMLVVTLSIIGIILLGGAIAYYLIVLRLPSSQEVYDNAIKVLLRGPAISYDTKITVSATSTDAEPEYLSINGKATGTLSISPKAFLKGKHYIDFSINHNGVPEPTNFKFDGNVFVLNDDIYISQNTPSTGTQIENLLKENEWLKAPYQRTGEILGLTSSKSIEGGQYGNIIPSTTLFKIFITNSAIVVNGELDKFVENGREMYKIPIKLDPKKAVLNTDLFNKYLRGTDAAPITAARAQILENRYANIQGELIVDKLLMRPLKLSLSGKFDPSKMPLNGVVNINTSFTFQNQDPVVEVKGKTLEEIKALRLEESMSTSILAKDAPVKTIIPVITLALKQYSEKFGRYPLTINDLVLSGFLGEGAITNDISTKIFYSSYVEKPKDTVSGIRCTAKNVKCEFYHLGANLEFRKSSELDNDADFITSQISGSDDSGCHNESNVSCYDLIGELQKGN